MGSIVEPFSSGKRHFITLPSTRGFEASDRMQELAYICTFEARENMRLGKSASPFDSTPPNPPLPAPSLSMGPPIKEAEATDPNGAQDVFYGWDQVKLWRSIWDMDRELPDLTVRPTGYFRAQREKGGWFWRYPAWEFKLFLQHRVGAARTIEAAVEEEDTEEEVEVSEAGVTGSAGGMEEEQVAKEPPLQQARTRSNRTSARKRKATSAFDGEDVEENASDEAYAGESAGPSRKRARKAVANPTTSPAVVSGESSSEPKESAKPKLQRGGVNTCNKPRAPFQSFGENMKRFLDEYAPGKGNLTRLGFADVEMAPGAKDGPLADLPDLNMEAKEYETLKAKGFYSVGNVGAATDLHPSEVKACQILRWTAETYRSQKARSFVGMALLTEYNEQQGRLDRSKPAGFRKTQMQQACNADVNIVALLYDIFGQFGWLGGGVDWFPGAHRAGWAQQLQTWELSRTAGSFVKTGVRFTRSPCADWKFDA